MNCKNIILEFINKITNNKIEIYNEASVQYELAIFLREKFPTFEIQLERNVSFFDLDKKDFIKKEMDIVIFNKNKNEKTTVEIKFPRNGQYPEQMFSFCKDIKFLEQLHSNGFTNNIFLAFTNDHNFWNDVGKEDTIYEMFRKRKKIEGIIRKPTGKKDEVIDLNGIYDIKWNPVNSELRYFGIWQID